MKTQEQVKQIELKDIESQQQQSQRKVQPTTAYTPIDLCFKDLFYSVQVPDDEGVLRERVILDKVNGLCKYGEVTAILGASGAGKTSLLNILAQRIETGPLAKLTGDIKANDLKYDFVSFPKFATYVMQDDRLMESMTVQECLQFAADLKMKATQQEKNDRVHDIIRLMRLDRAKNTLVGGQFLKGISGGERKRTSIGFEIVCDPQVILLDEPTSGLDSFTAFLLILTLYRYSRTGKTVVFTIHQPSSEIWQLFDRILLLVDGHLIYQGKGQESILNYFSGMGFKCPSDNNPADYFMSIMHRESEVLQDIQNRHMGQVQFYTTQNSFGYEMRKIAGRTVTNMLRNPILLRARFFQSVFLSLFVIAIYWHLPNGYGASATSITDVNNKNGFLFFTVVNQFMLSMQPTVLTFPAERNVFLKEANMQMYGLRSYFLGKTMPELPFLAIMPIIYELIVYWTVQLDTTSGNEFFTFYFILLMLSLCGNSLGLATGAAFPTTRQAMALMPLFLLPFMLFGGFYNNQGSYQDWIGWLQYLSPFYYGFEAMTWNQYAHTGFRPNPETLLNLKLSMWNSIILMIVLFVVYRIVALLFLWKNTKKLQ